MSRFFSSVCSDISHLQKGSLFPIYLIGSFPKPPYIQIPSWFDGSSSAEYNLSDYNAYGEGLKSDDKHPYFLRMAFDEVIQQQIDMHADIITDGEINRENYIWHFCRHCINGVTFTNPKSVPLRNETCYMNVPRITSKITNKNLRILGEEWLDSQNVSKLPLKIAIPGPMTIMDSAHNEYYSGVGNANNSKQLLRDLSFAINEQILTLIDNYGVEYIQIDEPVFARKPELAQEIGFECMQNCWKDVKSSNMDMDVHDIVDVAASSSSASVGTVYKSVHICCGYTDKLDDPEYQKAENHSYVQLADFGMDSIFFNECGINAISIEDAHSRVPMQFFQEINKLDIILGCVRVCESRIDTHDEIIARVNEVINIGNVCPTKLMLAPDCGLAFLSLNAIEMKMKELVLARDMLRKEYSEKYANVI